jgi:predicted ester cyclase
MQSPTTPDTIRELVRRYVDAYQTGDTTPLEDIIGPSFVDHSFPAFSGGPDGVRRSINSLHAGFGEIECAIEDCVCNADTAALRVVTSAMHTGTFHGKPATGKRVT